MDQTKMTPCVQTPLLFSWLPRDIVVEIDDYLLILYHQEIQNYFISNIAVQITSYFADYQIDIIQANEGEMLLNYRKQKGEMFEQSQIPLSLIKCIIGSRKLVKYLKTLPKFPRPHYFVRDMTLYTIQKLESVASVDLTFLRSIYLDLRKVMRSITIYKLGYLGEILPVIRQNQQAIVEYIIEHNITESTGRLADYYTDTFDDCVIYYYGLGNCHYYDLHN